MRLEELAVLFCVTLRWCCSSTPFLWSCPKKRGGAPKKNAWGGGAPVRFRDPPASPTRVGAATRPLRCPLRGRILSLAPGARGLGWQKSRPVKVFCPAFLQKSGRGPGAEPWPRAAARGTPLMLMKRRRGSKGGPSPGVPPLRAAPPPAARATSWGRRWTKARDVEDADPYGGWETGRAPRDLLRYYPAPGRGSAEHGKAGGDRDGGTSGAPSPTGRLRRRGAGGRPASGRGWNPAPTVGWQNAATFMGRRGSRPAIISKTPPDGRRFHLFIMSAERILERSKTGATGGRGQSFYA